SNVAGFPHSLKVLTGQLVSGDEIFRIPFDSLLKKTNRLLFDISVGRQQFCWNCGGICCQCCAAAAARAQDECEKNKTDNLGELDCFDQHGKSLPDTRSKRPALV